MRDPAILLAGATLGALAVLGLQAAAGAPRTPCSDASNFSRIAKRFDDLEQAVTAPQRQSAQAAAAAALAHDNAHSELARISSQVADLNVEVVALANRVRP